MSPAVGVREAEKAGAGTTTFGAAPRGAAARTATCAAARAGKAAEHRAKDAMTEKIRRIGRL